jgi:hypothetical protein
VLATELLNRSRLARAGLKIIFIVFHTRRVPQEEHNLKIRQSACAGAASYRTFVPNYDLARCRQPIALRKPSDIGDTICAAMALQTCSRMPINGDVTTINEVATQRNLALHAKVSVDPGRTASK